jgi:uncharacterized FlaG/YvyC family protein
METEIAVALIGGATTMIVALLEWTRRQNNRDHATNANKLDKVIEKIEKVDDRLSSHMDWHLHDDPN